MKKLFIYVIALVIREFGLNANESSLLWAREINTWKDEFEKEQVIEQTNEAYTEYYVTEIERTAREYAEKRLSLYKKIFGLNE